MAFWSAQRARHGAARASAAFAQLASAPAWQLSAITATVGIALGIGTIVVSTRSTQWVGLFVLAVLGIATAFVVGSVRRLLLVAILLDIPVQLDANLAYRPDMAALGGLVGFNVSVTTIALHGLYLLWLGGYLAKITPQPRPALQTSLPLALYLGCVVLSSVAARDVTLALFEIFLLLQMFLLYLYIASTVRTQQDLRLIVSLLLIGMIFESLIMIGVYATGRHFNFGSISTRVDASYGSRAGGLFGSPNAAAAYLGLLLPPALGLMLAQARRSYKLLAALAFGLGIIALVLTQSRGGWLSVALSSSILCLFIWRRGWLRLQVHFVIGFVVLLLLLVFRDVIAARLFADDGGSAHSRIPLMKLALQMIKDNVVLGIGANNFAIGIKQYATPEFAGEWLYVVHNKYLLVAAETGIVGLAAFLLFLAGVVRQAWRQWRRNDRFVSPLALGCLAAVIGHMAHMLTDLFNGRVQVQLLWLVAGLIAAMHNVDAEGR